MTCVNIENKNKNFQLEAKKKKSRKKHTNKPIYRTSKNDFTFNVNNKRNDKS